VVAPALPYSGIALLALGGVREKCTGKFPTAFLSEINVGDCYAAAGAYVLLEKKYHSSIINLTGNKKPDSEHVFYPNNWFDVLRLLLKLEYDIVHVHIGGNLTPRLLGLCLTCCLIPKAKSVLTFHSGGYPLL